MGGPRLDAWATQRDEQGFTFVELMVVVVVIAVLIAMAVPAYAGARKRAEERATQSNIRTAFIAERTVYALNGTVSSDAAGTLPDIEPSIHWVADATPTNATRDTVTVSVGSVTTIDDSVVLGAKAADGTCFYLRNAAGEPVQYAADQSCARTTNSLVSGVTSPSGGWRTSW
jgi:type IV pilus assembly protein PilA